MKHDIQRHSRIALRKGSLVGRRDFLRQISALGIASGACSWTDVISASAEELRSRGMSCILLWMQGGPSQFETFAPKPNHKNGGETKAISTNVAGIQFAEHLPYCAKIADQLAIVRSMTSKEGNHQRATFLLHHGYLPMGGVKFPTLGANVAHQIGDAASQLPSYVRIGNRLANSGGGGFLGVQYDPLVLRNANRPPDNTQLTTSNQRFERRMRLLGSLESDFTRTTGAKSVSDHRELLSQASQLVMSPDMSAFDIEQEPQNVRDSYGRGDFAAGCLMARRLVEHGVTFVEVVSRGWDTHQDSFTRTSQLAGQIDQPTASLITDLQQRGLLEKTLVVWMGEFGRTPRINARAGRDHYPKAFSVMLAGGGVQGGQVIGETDPAGVEVTQQPVTVDDLFRSIYHALEIDADHENMSRIGRPIRLVEGGTVVDDLFG